MEGAKTLKLGYNSEKRQIVLFLLFTCIILVSAAVVLYLIPYIGFTNIHPKLPLIILYLVGGALTLVFTIIVGKSLFFNRRIRGQFIRLLFPILVVIGKFIDINKGQLRLAFISINNRLVLAEAPFVKPDNLLILIPHCLQYHECVVRITGNVENCKACGECRIKDLVALSRKYHVTIAAVTGGTLARRVVKEKRPNMIIAVACDRDLASGIQDVHPIPVFGILNERPNGPCFDTNVEALVEKALSFFLGNKAPLASG
ncbi:MAG: DUF116 domain-containing protein [Deltaproteobacteria bacterium]|nr:DUF116 domain-containing protein [Deltaproteobacteria bacterium]